MTNATKEKVASDSESQPRRIPVIFDDGLGGKKRKILVRACIPSQPLYLTGILKISLPSESTIESLANEIAMSLQVDADRLELLTLEDFELRRQE
jgi:hypothetical protein